VEASAIGTAFRDCRSSEEPLYMYVHAIFRLSKLSSMVHLILKYSFRGAVKSNIGHLEGASGIAGIIKTIMVLEAAVIPPNANFGALNPSIDKDHLRIEVCIILRPSMHRH